MSEHSQSVQTPQSNATLNPTQLNALAEKFKELAQAIQAISQTESPKPISEEIPKKPKEPDQIRCYRVPGFIVRYEQETLTEHRAADLLGLLRKARDDFHTTSTLLQNFHEDNSYQVAINKVLIYDNLHTGGYYAPFHPDSAATTC